MKKAIASFTLVGLTAICPSAYPQAPIPGGVESAGLTYIVQDTPLWYNTNHLLGRPFAGYVTNGPIYNLSDQLSTKTALPVGSGNYGNWEPYTSVIGDHTFMVACGIFADDGSWYGSTNLVGAQANQRYVMALQPVTGGQPKIAELFYDDFGQPYALHQMLRQRNPGVRVAGDKRYGANNFMSGGSSALMYARHWFGIDYFNTDGRLNTAWPLYGTAFPSDCNNNGSCGAPGTSDSQWAFLQTFALDPATLVQYPLANAFEPIFFPAWTNNAPPRLCAAANLDCGLGFTAERNVAYFGGDIVALSDGNFLVVADDYTGFFGGRTTGANAVAKIVRPDGSSVKDTWLVDPREIWSNIAAYRGGFAIRVQSLFYFFDNAGNPIATNEVANSTGMTFDQTRGDSTRITSDIRSYYVYIAGVVTPPDGGTGCGLGIWDGRTGEFVTNAVVSSDLDAFSVSTASTRVGVAVDALDRVCVVWDGRPDSSFFQNQHIARVMEFDGTNVSYLTPSFFPFISADNTNNITANGNLGFISANPHVAMTTKAICIAAKAWVNSTNNPAGGPDSGLETTVYTVITHPAPVNPPRPRMTVTKSGNTAIIAWGADTGLFTLESRPALESGSWAPVSPQPVTVLDTNAIPNLHKMTVTIGSGPLFFRLAR